MPTCAGAEPRIMATSRGMAGAVKKSAGPHFADHAMNDTSATPAIVTAGLLVIGDEILSGRTKDKNIGFIAEYLTALGIDLMEVRVVGDEESAVIDALNALRHRYTYVFTTGGIGPT